LIFKLGNKAGTLAVGHDLHISMCNSSKNNRHPRNLVKFKSEAKFSIDYTK
jgi:hypothetical protein